MFVSISWSFMDPAWLGPRHMRPCLYAYLHPRRDEILYIGVAKTGRGLTPSQTADRKALFTFLRRRLRLKSVRFLGSRLLTDARVSVTNELLAQAQSLLVRRVRPRGNLAVGQPLISRPGLVVECGGNWPVPGRYVDRGNNPNSEHRRRVRWNEPA